MNNPVEHGHSKAPALNGEDSPVRISRRTMFERFLNKPLVVNPNATNKDKTIDGIRTFLSTEITRRQALKTGVAVALAIPPIEKEVKRGLLQTIGNIGKGLIESYRPEALNAAEEALSPLKMTREQLEALPNKIGITKMKDVVDTNGNTIKTYVLLDNGYFYESHLDPITQKFTEFKITSDNKLPMENPTAFAISEDGQTIIVGGENQTRMADTKFVISYDGGKTWNQVPWTFGSQGNAISIKSIKGTNKFLANVQGEYHDEGIKSLYVIDVDLSKPIEQRATAGQTDLAERPSTDLTITSVNLVTKEIEAFATGSTTISTGIDRYTINYETNAVSKTRIEQVIVKINGVDTVAYLGLLTGLSQYTDTSGHRHILTSDGYSKVLFNIDLDDIDSATGKPRATYVEFANWHNALSDAYTNSSIIAATQTIIDTDGKLHVLFGGGYSSKTTSYTKAAYGHLLWGNSTPDQIFYPSPNSIAAIGEEENFQLKTVKGVKGVDLIILSWGNTGAPGRIFRALGTDNRFDENPEELFAVKGLEVEIIPPTATPTPTPTPTARPTETPTPSPTATPTPVAEICQQGWEYFIQAGKCLKRGAAYIPLAAKKALGGW